MHRIPIPPNQREHCLLIIYITVAAIHCSVGLIVTLTFERFYSIVRPHKAASFNTTSRAKIIIMCIIIFCALFNVPLYFTSSSFGVNCISFSVNSGNTLINAYLLVFFFVLVLIPFTSLLIMNSVIIHTLRKRPSYQDKGQIQGQGHAQGQVNRIKQSERQIYVMLLLVTFAFLIFYIPGISMVFYINYIHGTTPHFYASQHFVFHFGEKSYFSNHAINFFLYVISGQKFRNDLVKLFRCETLNKCNSLNVINGSSSVRSEATKLAEIGEMTTTMTTKQEYIPVGCVPAAH